MLPPVTEAVERALAAAEAAQGRTNAFLALLSERARAAAAGGPEGARRAGVPGAREDNLCVAGAPTAAASRVLEGCEPPYTATVVARLGAAGAGVIGKTNLDESGMGSTNENSAYGPVVNPLDPGRVAGGAAGGSAPAVA